jgi:hypothetical protein
VTRSLACHQLFEVDTGAEGTNCFVPLEACTAFPEALDVDYLSNELSVQCRIRLLSILLWMPR